MKAGTTDLPQLGASCADTHAHLDMLDDPAGALERAALAGVTFIATVADATEMPRGTYDSLQEWGDTAQQRLDEWGVPDRVPPTVRVIVGTHPHNAKGYSQLVAEDTMVLGADPRTVAIGEIGLDFHYAHSPQGAQRLAFRDQLVIAEQLDLPVVVHLREAHEEGLGILEQVGVPTAGCVIHCFTEGPELAKQFVELGCHVSFAGPITFKNADEIRAAAAVVPLDRILTETDCPFLAPEPYRGKTNEPAWTTFTVAALAQARGEDPAELAAASYANALKLFGGSAPEPA
jgi:TatD DNase family protein